MWQNISLLIVFCCLSWPAFAQKNLLPAVRTAAFKSPVSVSPKTAGNIPLGVKKLPKKAFSASLQRAVFQQTQAQTQARYAQQNEAVRKEIDALWKINEEWLGSEIFDSMYEVLEGNTAFALQNNRVVLLSSKNLFEKFLWLKQQPNSAQDKLKRVQSDNLAEELARRVSDRDLIFLGEIHFSPPVQRSICAVMHALREQNPGRRIVLFTEFMNLPRTKTSVKEPLSFYARKEGVAHLKPVKWGENYPEGDLDYAKELFEELLKDDFEIYPLEDNVLYNILMREEPLLESSETSALSIVRRNQMWARVMEAKMAEVRKTDPDAVFVVYAGMGHTSWLAPFSMPKFFAQERRAVVELTEGSQSGFNTLEEVWDWKHPYFHQQGLFFWKGENALLLGRQTGFDFALILPRYME